MFIESFSQMNQEFHMNQRVLCEDQGFGTVTDVVLYPDGDLHYYVVELDNGRTFECGNYELESVE